MKNKTLWLFIASLIGFGIGYFLSYIYNCGNSNFCYFLFSRVGNPLFYGMGALAIVFLALLFIPRVFSTWLKFGIWFVPLAALLFVFVPEPQGWITLTPAPESVFKWVSGFYVVASLAIIGWAALRNKN